MALFKKKQKNKGLYSVIQKDINTLIVRYTLLSMPVAITIGLVASPIYRQYTENKTLATDSRTAIESSLTQIANSNIQLAEKTATLTEKKVKLKEAGITREVTTSVDNYIRYMDVKAGDYGLKLENTDIISSLANEDNQVQTTTNETTQSNDTKLIKATVKGYYKNITLFLASLNTKQVIYIIDLNIQSEPLTDYSIANLVLSLTPPTGSNTDLLDSMNNVPDKPQENTTTPPPATPQTPVQNQTPPGTTQDQSQTPPTTQPQTQPGTTQGQGQGQTNGTQSEIDTLYGNGGN